jgi:hypothetical protein
MRFGSGVAASCRTKTALPEIVVQETAWPDSDQKEDSML